MGAGVGYGMPRPEGREPVQPHEYTAPTQGDPFTGVITNFFGFDPTGMTGSLIPGYSESEPILRTPTPAEPEIHPEDEVPLQGRGMREHNAPSRLSPSGPRPRRPRNRPRVNN